AAAVVMWARAVSEFGAIVILTYNPKVVSVLRYDRFTSFRLSETLPVAAVLVLFALIPLAALRALRSARPLPRWSPLVTPLHSGYALARTFALTAESLDVPHCLYG